MLRLAGSLVVIAVITLCIAASGGAAPQVPARCCFTVAVDVHGGYTDEYKGAGVGTWKGKTEVEWEWATRFIAAYTGSGLSLKPGAEGAAATSSNSNYTIIFSDPAFNTKATCPTGASEPPLTTPPPLAPIPSSGLASAQRNLNGYARALVVRAPPALNVTCAPLGGDDPDVRDLLDASSYVLKAPSVNNFLGGKSFGRSCWRYVDVTFSSPFVHTVNGAVSLGMHFTWFSRADLKNKENALARMAGKEAKDTVDYGRALDSALAAQSAGKTAAGCK